MKRRFTFVKEMFFFLNPVLAGAINGSKLCMGTFNSLSHAFFRFPFVYYTRKFPREILNYAFGIKSPLSFLSRFSLLKKYKKLTVQISCLTENMDRKSDADVRL